MKSERQADVLHQWGQKILGQLDSGLYRSLIETASKVNPWFSEDDIRLSLSAIAENYLDGKMIKQWLESYDTGDEKGKIVALIMAGNIPMAGMHDLLTVWLSGNIALVKMSSKDDVLLPFLLNELYEIEPAYRFKTLIADDFKGQEIDAVIATGSDNSARYFEYYFGKYPHVIRKNRNSVAVIKGNETEEEIKNLGIDIFSYSGLGCRNVSKLFLPEDHDLGMIYEPLQDYSNVIEHQKYLNNYNYYKSIYLINRVKHWDNGFLILMESEALVTPVSVLHFERYAKLEEVATKLNAVQDKIQVVVGDVLSDIPSVPFGQSQKPRLWDYADRVDTMKFLLGLR